MERNIARNRRKEKGWRVRGRMELDTRGTKSKERIVSLWVRCREGLRILLGKEMATR